MHGTGTLERGCAGELESRSDSGEPERGRGLAWLVQWTRGGQLAAGSCVELRATKLSRQPKPTSGTRFELVF